MPFDAFASLNASLKTAVWLQNGKLKRMYNTHESGFIPISPTNDVHLPLCDLKAGDPYSLACS